ncbi:accessory gene regulator ArgB-like protein [Alkaliphilus hydrothermalis]|uniref:Accessory gene regulator B n=1 Tax=Alkaliphilus hydrothermalis TaxID=1482730 RepID=A0ABS2NRB7_9FIRM|nr:accessory gene regulator B family protein [Alkaliphilus hydrothermalis]MBM7615500.1 accessory gene regulator B [Alkaliphilus hydrothermalis]
MIEKISKRLTIRLIDEGVVSLDEFEIYHYGMQLLLATLMEGFGLLILGILTGKVIETVLFVLMFGLLRIFAGGIHAGSYLKCFIVTAIVVFIGVQVVEILQYNFGFNFMLIMLIITNTIVYIFSPIDSPNKPLTDGEKVKNRRRSLLITFVGALIIVFFYKINPNLKYYLFIITFALFSESLTLIRVSRDKYFLLEVK